MFQFHNIIYLNGDPFHENVIGGAKVIGGGGGKGGRGGRRCRRPSWECVGKRSLQRVSPSFLLWA